MSAAVSYELIPLAQTLKEANTTPSKETTDLLERLFQTIQASAHSALRALVEQLPELQGRVLKMRYGIEAGEPQESSEPMSLSAIAKQLGMSRDKTRNLERKALEGVRAQSRMLEGYLVA